MPALFDTYSSEYKLERLDDGRPILVPKDTPEAYNKVAAIVNRDYQIAHYLRSHISSMFEIGCDAGHLLALAEYSGIYSMGIEIDTSAVKACVSQGINCSYADMTVLSCGEPLNPYYSAIQRAARKCELVAFLNFSHVEWPGEASKYKNQLFMYARENFRYILCSAYDDDVSSLESRYDMSLVHSFSNWRHTFNRRDNLRVQYEEKIYTCCLETYTNLQKIFEVRSSL